MCFPRFWCIFQHFPSLASTMRYNTYDAILNTVQRVCKCVALWIAKIALHLPTSNWTLPEQDHILPIGYDCFNHVSFYLLVLYWNTIIVKQHRVNALQRREHDARNKLHWIFVQGINPSARHRHYTVMVHRSNSPFIVSLTLHQITTPKWLCRLTIIFLVY